MSLQETKDMKFVLKIFTFFSPYLDYFTITPHVTVKSLFRSSYFLDTCSLKAPGWPSCWGSCCDIHRYRALGQCSSSGSGTRDQFIEQMAMLLSLTNAVLYSGLLGAKADGVSFSTSFHL